MTQKAEKARVALIEYAGLEFEGLMLPNGQFRIGVSQLEVLKLIPQKNASRDTKVLLGKGFQFLKVSSELHPKKVNTLNLEEFNKLLMALAVLAKKGLTD